MEVFVSRLKPELAYVLWKQRLGAMLCDQCNHVLEGTFAVIDLPNESELNDPDYEPIGSYALCRACARRFYKLTRKDMGKVDRLWLVCDAKHVT